MFGKLTSKRKQKFRPDFDPIPGGGSNLGKRGAQLGLRLLREGSEVVTNGEGHCPARRGHREARFG